ncbi:dethiobiotin synthase [Polynucleobacter sp. 15G-AUS-farblos]|uniref:dethiobiotin synthase n=1 Tax=Polynucleobacter sp. 15G-AUS-farblos TaxID=2689094 RepID=UPI001C0C5E24|nr:dethiobiotin synthase [Polynucleobacter sp. 15G-AUS-farblos]MBU3583894.1 dethiobiotin synthase [Polynucleobacter sp. 15G-AUS-farblos]
MSLANGFFITGTDTEVGKTLVAGALILKMREQGINTVGFKPIVAGTYQDHDGKILNEDLETLRLASQLAPEQMVLCPYILDMPIAPHIASEKLGIHLDLQIMMGAYEQIRSQVEALVVEGAGGFLVPINATENLSDLAQKLQLPIIMVVGMRLGCINHALLTEEALTSRQLKVAGWIANTLASEMPFLEENIQYLQHKMRAPLLGVIPSLPASLKKQIDAPYSIEALQFAAQHINLLKP